MTAREIITLIDYATDVYVCTETGEVIGKTSEFEWADQLLDKEIANITTYNYGIEIDLKDVF